MKEAREEQCESRSSNPSCSSKGPSILQLLKSSIIGALHTTVQVSAMQVASLISNPCLSYLMTLSNKTMQRQGKLSCRPHHTTTEPVFSQHQMRTHCCPTVVPISRARHSQLLDCIKEVAHHAVPIARVAIRTPLRQHLLPICKAALELH